MTTSKTIDLFFSDPRFEKLFFACAEDFAANRGNPDQYTASMKECIDSILGATEITKNMIMLDRPFGFKSKVHFTSMFSSFPAVLKVQMTGHKEFAWSVVIEH